MIKQTEGRVKADTIVLIVDDEAPLRATIMRVLRFESYSPGNLFEAAGAMEALAIFKDLKNRNCMPHCVVCDFYMPGMLGLDFFKKLRGLYGSYYADIIKVLISGVGMPTEMDTVMRDCQPLGVRMLHKPFATNALLAAIENVDYEK